MNRDYPPKDWIDQEIETWRYGRLKAWLWKRGGAHRPGSFDYHMAKSAFYWRLAGVFLAISIAAQIASVVMRFCR